MGSKAKRLPIRILKIWFDVCLVLAGAATLIFLVWLFISPIVMTGRDIPADAAVQVVVGQRTWFPVYQLEYTGPKIASTLLRTSG